MNFVYFLYIVFLFFVLTPAILLRIPPKGNKWLVALVHGGVFAVILLLTSEFVLSLGKKMEGLTTQSNVVDLSFNPLDSSMNKMNDIVNDLSGNVDSLSANLDNKYTLVK